MNWWGKLLGAACGLVIAGPVGALVGVAIGHLFDLGMRRLRIMPPPADEKERIQLSFFSTTFQVMGRLAKVDGRVSEDEIAFARKVMTNMALNTAQTREAIRLFTEGKDPAFPLDKTLDRFRRLCRRQPNLLRMFLEMQMQAAYADGDLKTVERELLLHLFRRLGFNRADFDQLDAMARSANHFAGGQERRKDGGGKKRSSRPAPAPRERAREAYDILGVQPHAADADVKRAYRRLMAQHHPDKLVAKGLPEEMVRLATERTQEIKNAYEAVKTARGMR